MSQEQNVMIISGPDFRTRWLRFSTDHLLIEGLPAISLPSIRACRPQTIWGPPHLNVEWIDGQGKIKRLTLYQSPWPPLRKWSRSWAGVQNLVAISQLHDQIGRLAGLEELVSVSGRSRYRRRSGVFCPSCHAENESKTLTCTSCGQSLERRWFQRLTQPNEKRLCHRCGEPDGVLLLGKIPIVDCSGDWFESRYCCVWYCPMCHGDFRWEKGGFLKSRKVYCKLCDRQLKRHDRTSD